MDQLSFDPGQFPAAERFDRWRAGIEDFLVEEIDTSRPFDGRSIVTSLGGLMISESVLPPLRFTRTAAMIRARRRDQFSLSLILEGSVKGIADGTPFAVGAGGALLLDFSRPSQVVSSRHRSMVIVIPRSLLGIGPNADAHGPLPDGAETRLLVACLNGLSPALAGLRPTAALPTARALCELLAACLPQDAERGQASRLRSQALRARLRDHVEANLDADLTVERLCSDLAVSRSALYRAVEGDGGIVGLVRTARLEWTHRALSDRTEGRTIQQIAHAAGFRNEARFSRLFHATFGYTADSLRRTAAIPSALPPESPDAAIAFRDAVERLAAGPSPG